MTRAHPASRVLAAWGAAARLSINVVNGRGTEKASLVQLTSAACPAGCTRFTDGHGRLALDVAPGDRVAVTRGGPVAEASYT
ncbi:MAG: hypothetical protein H0T69_06875, partial [Thermoleophilaceae bacterium]|nr:hypothetical protein [Thermoleophilaceae bacterium]